MIRRESIFAAISITAILYISHPSASAEELLPKISVAGTAEVFVVPDNLIISSGVESKAKEIKAAVADNKAKINQILKFLNDSGIESKHVHTEQIRIEPIYEQAQRVKGYGLKQSMEQMMFQEAQKPNDDPFSTASEPNAPENADEEKFDPFAKELPIGYTVRRQFTITLVEINKFEPIYQGLIELGINRVSDIEYRSSKMRELHDQTRLEAVRDAKTKAAAMAAELGATLASVESITEGSTARSGYRHYGVVVDDPFGDPEVNDSFAAGQISISASVNVDFRLGNTELAK